MVAIKAPCFAAHGKNNGASKCRNRQAIRSREGLHRLAQAMGRRAHVRVAWTMQAPGQGLGKSQPPGPRIPTSRVDQAHAEKAMQSNMIFPDRTLQLHFLSEVSAASV